MPETENDWVKRFWDNVYVDESQPDNPSPCWLWKGPTFEVNGLVRPYFNIGSKTYRAHALAWQLLRGPIPEGLYLLHKCNNPLCIRPDKNHVYPGDQKQNLRDLQDRRRRGEL